MKRESKIEKGGKKPYVTMSMQ